MKTECNAANFNHVAVLYLNTVLHLNLREYLKYFILYFVKNGILYGENREHKRNKINKKEKHLDFQNLFKFTGKIPFYIWAMLYFKPTFIPYE